MRGCVLFPSGHISFVINDIANFLASGREDVLLTLIVLHADILCQTVMRLPLSMTT